MFDDRSIPEKDKWWNKLKWWQMLLGLWWCAWGALVSYAVKDVLSIWARIITLFWAMVTFFMMLYAAIANTETSQQPHHFLPLQIGQSDEVTRAWEAATRRVTIAKSTLDAAIGVLSQGRKLSPTEVEKVQQEALQSLSGFLLLLSSRTDWFREFGLIELLAGIDRSSQSVQTLENVRRFIAEDLLPHIQETHRALIDCEDLPSRILLLKQSAPHA